MLRRKCPKCRRRKRIHPFHCEWCDDCQLSATDDIMRMIGYTVSFCHKDLIDDAEETWQAAWDLTMNLPHDYPDYSALCDILSDICPVPGEQ